MIHKITLPVPYDVGTVNVYLIEGDELTLVDTGVKTEKSWLSFQQQLNQLGYRIEDIKHIVLTHHHVDHIGMLEYFSENIDVVAHKDVDVWSSQNPAFIEHYNQELEQFRIEFGIPIELKERGINLERTLQLSCKRHVTAIVKEGDYLSFLPQFKVIEVPGHASTHIALYREEDGVLIGGDVLIAKISSNPMLEPRGIGEKERIRPLLQYNDSLQKLATMDITKVLAGHGEDVTNIKALVFERLEKQKKRSHRVLEMIQEEGNTVFELTKGLFPTLYERQLLLTISETLGQLDYLEYNGQVDVDRTQTPHRYFVRKK
ncbi:MAG: MBL fold metallo-hydrolase [Bacillaceae bacterium]